MIEASGSAPAGSKHWGLGALVSHCANAGLIPSDLLDNLRLLNDHRKTLYHFGHSESETALLQRTDELIREIGSSKLCEDFQEERGYEGDNNQVFKFAMDRVLRQNALSARSTAFKLRSWLASNPHPGQC